MRLELLVRLKWHCNRKLERVSLVIADQPGANDDDSALQVDAALYSVNRKRDRLLLRCHAPDARNGKDASAWRVNK